MFSTPDVILRKYMARTKLCFAGEHEVFFLISLSYRVIGIIRDQRIYILWLIDPFIDNIYWTFIQVDECT